MDGWPSAHRWSKSQVIFLLYLAGWRAVVFAVFVVIASLLEVANVCVVRLVPRCLHCMPHDVGDALASDVVAGKCSW